MGATTNWKEYRKKTKVLAQVIEVEKIMLPDAQSPAAPVRPFKKGDYMVLVAVEEGDMACGMAKSDFEAENEPVRKPKAQTAADSKKKKSS